MKTILAILVFLFVPAIASAQVITVKLEDQAPDVIELTPIQQENGDISFNGTKTYKDPKNEALTHKLSWTLKIVGANKGKIGEYLMKDATIVVETDPAATPLNFTIEASLPCHEYSNIILSGACSLKLKANQGGGSVNCSEQPSGTTFISPMFDGLDLENPACAAFYCPFQMQGTGAGQMQTSQLFKNTCLNQKARNISSIVGLKIRGKMTGGETLTTQTSMIATCREDLNWDGKVNGADMGILLGNWGKPGVGDLDGSGKVDGADVGSLLGAYTAD